MVYDSRRRDFIVLIIAKLPIHAFREFIYFWNSSQYQSYFSQQYNNAVRRIGLKHTSGRNNILKHLNQDVPFDTPLILSLTNKKL